MTYPLILGIETSCDETAAAIVGGDRQILAERVLSQLAEHRPYGGVVPEIAARSHLDHLDRLIAETMTAAGLGVRGARRHRRDRRSRPDRRRHRRRDDRQGHRRRRTSKPFIAVNHLEGHALTARLTDDIAFPYLLLLVSGGHCQLLIVEDVGRYRRLGTTVDDAAGEAFDKGAKLLGLGYPGGPAVERGGAVGR